MWLRGGHPGGAVGGKLVRVQAKGAGVFVVVVETAVRLLRVYFD